MLSCVFHITGIKFQKLSISLFQLMVTVYPKTKKKLAPGIACGIESCNLSLKPPELIAFREWMAGPLVFSSVASTCDQVWWATKMDLTCVKASVSTSGRWIFFYFLYHVVSVWLFLCLYGSEQQLHMCIFFLNKKTVSLIILSEMEESIFVPSTCFCF